MRRLLTLLILALPFSLAAETRSPGKPGAPFAVEHRLLGPARKGEVVEVEVLIKPTGTTRAARVSVEADAALGLERGGGEHHLRKTAAEPERLVLRLRPTADGVHTVRVIVEAAFGARERARVALIEVPVGEGAVRKPVANGQPVEGERRVVVLPSSTPGR